MVISLDAFLPPLIQGSDVPLVGTTPGVRIASENGLRPFSGSSRIILLPITVETLEEAVVSCAVLAWTSIVVAMSPTFSLTSSETVCCTSTRTPLVTSF